MDIRMSAIPPMMATMRFAMASMIPPMALAIADTTEPMTLTRLYVVYGRNGGDMCGAFVAKGWAIRQ